MAPILKHGTKVGNQDRLRWTAAALRRVHPRPNILARRSSSDGFKPSTRKSVWRPPLLRRATSASRSGGRLSFWTSTVTSSDSIAFPSALTLKTRPNYGRCSRASRACGESHLRHPLVIMSRSDDEGSLGATCANGDSDVLSAAGYERRKIPGLRQGAGRSVASGGAAD